MGVKTRGVLIREALEQAGNTSLTLRAREWLDTVIVDLCAKAPWKFVTYRFGFTMGLGGRSINIGSPPNDDPTNMIQAIHSLTLAGDDQSLTIYNGDNIPSQLDPLLVADKPGRPSYVLVENNESPYDWTVTFGCSFTATTQVACTSQRVPVPLTDDSQFPIYPNDETILAALKAKALFHQEDPRWVAMHQMVYAPGGLLAQDMATYLKASTQQPKVGLARVKRSRGKKPWLGE